MFPRRIAVALVGQHLETGNQSCPGLARIDHVVEESATSGEIGVGEFLAELRFEFCGECRRVVCPGDLISIQNFDGPLRSHDRDLGRRPGEVQISPDVLR